jgi:predicted ArsR family transcriptional regulator
VEHDSRLRIIEVLKRRSQASVTELSQALGLTPVTIRHHLDSLLAEDVVSQPVPRRKSGPGRPEMVYGLTARADDLTPRNYGELCACLLQTAQASGGADRMLEQAGTRLASGAALPDEPDRMTRALGFFEARGYFPSVEATETGSAVVFANCPYLEVARVIPAFCRFDAALLGALLGVPVSPQSRIVESHAVCRMATSGDVPV